MSHRIGNKVVGPIRQKKLLLEGPNISRSKIYNMLDIVKVVGTFGQNMCGRKKSFEILERYSGSIHVTWTLKVDRVREQKFLQKAFSRHFPHSFFTFWDVTKMSDWTCNGPLIVTFSYKSKKAFRANFQRKDGMTHFLIPCKNPICFSHRKYSNFL